MNCLPYLNKNPTYIYLYDLDHFDHFDHLDHVDHVDHLDPLVGSGLVTKIKGIDH